MKSFLRVSVRMVSASVWGMVLVACGGSGEPSPTELGVTRLNQHWSLTDRQQLYAIQTSAAWSDAWQVHAPQTITAMPRPDVDFSRQMVLGVTQGSGPNGCHSLRIVRAVPPAAAVCTTAMVPLTDFVLVDRKNLPVVFSQVAS